MLSIAFCLFQVFFQTNIPVNTKRGQFKIQGNSCQSQRRLGAHSEWVIRVLVH